MTNLIGQTIGRYHILEQLGEGGMATVFKAYDTRLDRDVAIKIIRRKAFSEEQIDHILKRFEREAKSLGKVSHPNIVGVIDYGEHEGSPYLVMEYLPGGTLKQRVGRPMPWDESIRLLLPIARALAFAHEQGIVHRDVKPSNILITRSGDPMLTDFGIAKILEADDGVTLTGTGVGIGTPEYMAPEQWTGQATKQSDIYSLGIVLYEMVTGRKPYTADTPAAVLLKQANDPLPRPTQYAPDLPESAEKILLRALSKNPEDRYPTIVEFADAMEQLTFQTGKTLPPKPAPVPPEPARPLKEPKVKAGEETEDEIRAPAPGKKTPGWAWAVVAIGVVCLLVLGIPVVSWLSNGLGPATEAPAAPTKSEIQAGPVTITLWHSYHTGENEERALNQIIANYEASHPNVTVETLSVPFDQLANKWSNEVASGGGPDMFTMPNDDFGNWIRGGLVAPIDEYVAGRLDGFSQLAIDGMTYEGRLYGVPGIAKAVGLYYNKDLVPNPPATTAELLAQAREGRLLVMRPWDYFNYGWFTGGFGGALMDDTGRCVADRGGFVEAFQWMADLKAAGAVFEPDEGKANVMFTDGTAAFTVSGPWMLGSFRDAIGDRLGVVPLPAGPAGPATPLTGIDG
ncbi:MAG: extracellular solute-binding protein, partial [Chloroflexota bacterium]